MPSKYQQELIELGYQPLVCKICKFQSISTLVSHITRKHKITIQEYRDQYDVVVIQQTAPSLNQENRERNLKWFADEQNKKHYMNNRGYRPNEIMHWIKKGFTKTEAKELVSNFQRSLAQRQSNNLELKQKQREKSSGQNNPMSLTSIAKRHGVSIAEAKKLTPGFGRVGKLHPMFGKSHTDEALEKIASSGMFKNPTYKSKPEIEIFNFCKTLDENVKHGEKISRWNIDILFKNKMLVIEHFGTWWHMSPQYYSACDIHKVTKSTAQEVWDRDNRKIFDLQNLGYQVLIVWEHDWKKQQAVEIERIKNAYNNS